MSRPSRRDDVLAAAHQLFLKEGYDRVSVRRIAEAANLTTGAIYSHFAGKADMLGILVRELWESLEGCMERRLMESTAPSRMRRIFEGYQSFANDFSSHFDLLMYVGENEETFASLEPDVLMGIIELRTRIYAMVVEQVEIDIQAGYIPAGDPKVIMMAFTGIATGLLKQRRRTVQQVMNVDYQAVEAWAIDTLFMKMDRPDVPPMYLQSEPPQPTI
jgi:AcrR family transcriptional regulator